MYHVAANVPYMRYFLAHVLQFQFHAVLCDASGHSAAATYPTSPVALICTMQDTPAPWTRAACTAAALRAMCCNKCCAVEPAFPGKTFLGP